MNRLQARLPDLLKNCTFAQLNQIHGLLLTSSLHQLPAVAALLLRRATEVGATAHAELLFASSQENPHVLLYNAMVRGCAYHGPHERALRLFEEMPHRDLAPDSFTYPYVVDACARLGMWRYGEELHCRLLKEGFGCVPAVGSSLLAFYVANGSLGNARRVFDGFAIRSVGLSNRMMSEYIKIGDIHSAREIFDVMAGKDVVSWNSMLAACVKAADVVAAKELFAMMPARNIVSWTTMLRALSDAWDFIGMRSLFDRMPERNIVSWNCILSSYTRRGRFQQALHLFPRMLLEGLVPDSFTVVSVLSACGHLGKPRMGRWVHANLVTAALQSHAEVGTALVEMYAKCGHVDRAFAIFVKMDRKDVFCWNVMIRALAVHGRADDALRLFHLMTKQSFQPNHFTFMGVLMACSRGTLVDEGRRMFDAMQREYGVRPKLEQYGCLVDLLCRGGCIDEAAQVVENMPCGPDAGVWRALLAGCQVQNGLGLAEELTEGAMQVGSEDCDECEVEDGSCNQSS